MIRTVSVVIPCYRQASFLGECIASLQAQTHSDWEAIIVNDGSPDDTRAVASALAAADGRIRYLEQANSGPSAARNAGMAVAKGDAFQFLDADDLLQLDKLRHQVDILNSRPELGIVYSGAFYFQDGQPDRHRFNLFPRPVDNDWIQDGWAAWQSAPLGFVRHNLFPICCPLVRRSVVDGVGQFDTSLLAQEDWDYWWRCLDLGVRFAYVPQDAAHALIRVHGTSATHVSTRMHQGYVRLRHKHLASLSDGPMRDHNLDEMLRIAAELHSRGDLDTSMPLMAHARGLREHLQACLYLRLHQPWPGRSLLVAFCRAVPWRVRRWLGDIAGLRALCSV